MDEKKNKEIMLRDWLRLVDFGAEAQKFNSEQDQVVNEFDIFKQPGGKDRVTDVKRLHHLYDYRFFTMAPVYMHCSVPFDIMGEFRGITEADGSKYDGPRVTLEFNNPVFDGLNEWNNLLEGIYVGEDGYDKLVKFMTSQTIRQKDTGTYWTINHMEVMIPDPMAVDRNEYDPSNVDTKTVIGLFVPSGNKYKVGIQNRLLPPPIEFVKNSPDMQVVADSIKVLQVGT